VILEPVLTIVNEEDREKAEKILHKAERACLITNSLKAEIIFRPEIELASSLV
jgi:organic hydroperoxide reductase OsmC/OhrA